jgi:hypothetical protein
MNHNGKTQPLFWITPSTNGDADRAAIVLRFLEQRDLDAVGRALGTTEDAAQKRMGRALEKLRTILGRRGVLLSATSLAATLTTQASAPRSAPTLNHPPGRHPSLSRPREFGGCNCSLTGRCGA